MKDCDRLFLLLKGPDYYAHYSGQEMLTILNSGKRKRHIAMMKSADKHFNTIMFLFSIEQNVRILKTWLSFYQLPFSSEKLKNLNQFHSTHGKYIADNSQSIRSY
jgi:hypothetical protein